MLSSLYDMARQRRPTGPMWKIDDDWKRDVQAAMARKKITKADLARALGVVPATITLLFKPETMQTRLKPHVHRKLGMVEPTETPAVDRDETFRRLLRVWKDLTETQREHLIRTGEMLVGKG